MAGDQFGQSVVGVTGEIGGDLAGCQDLYRR